MSHTHNHDYSARKHPEFIAIDIGDETGALIVHTDASMHGVEIEISPAEDDHARSHKQVLERSIAGRPAFTLVFDGLRAGAYKLWTGPEPVVRIEPGTITELDWRLQGARP